MNDIDVNALMAQMQRLATLASGQAVQPKAAPRHADFAGVLKGMVEQVNDSQQRSEEMVRSFQAEEGAWDLPEVMVSLEKSRLSFETLMQVRNRVIQAYQDVMNMPL